MSYYYYPHLFDSESYLSKRGDSGNDDLLLNNATKYDFDFQMDMSGVAMDYRINDDLNGNLPQVLASALEEELVDVEDEETQEKIEQCADILKKIGSTDGMFSSLGILEPFVGFVTKEEVVVLIDFLESFAFQNDMVEELKGIMFDVLNVAKNNNRGLIYICT